MVRLVVLLLRMSTADTTGSTRFHGLPTAVTSPSATRTGSRFGKSGPEMFCQQSGNLRIGPPGSIGRATIPAHSDANAASTIAAEGKGNLSTP
jgi:hypothetical protein